MEELLYRLDERTMRIEQRMQRDMSEVKENVAENTEDIDTLESKVQHNKTILGGIAALVGTIGTILSAFVGHIAGIINL